MLRTTLLIAVLLTTSACANWRRTNPSFPITVNEAQQALREMETEPRPLQRPLIVLSGYVDPGIASGYLTRRLDRVTDGGPILGFSFLFESTFDDCREKVIAAVDQAFPSDDPEQTVEVDVIGVSMGGVVARYSALPMEGQRRLRIARLFTISSPHQGAEKASLPTWNQLHRDMRADSQLIRALEETADDLDYQLVAYVRLGDDIVGEANAAPTGQPLWWVSNQPLSRAHAGAFRDPRIIADIARRLRDEPPYTLHPPAPLPGDEPEEHEQPADPQTRTAPDKHAPR